MRDKKKALKVQCDELVRYCAIKKYGQKCEVYEAQGSDVHHLFTRHSFPGLRHDLDNLIILCRKRHFKHHFRGDPTIQWAIITKRGKKWWNRLLKKSQKLAISLGIKYFQDKIIELKKFIQF